MKILVQLASAVVGGLIMMTISIWVIKRKLRKSGRTDEQYDTDEEIVKSLVGCINDCDKCLNNFKDCEYKAMRNAVGLIERLKRDSKKYRNKYMGQKGELTRLYKETKNQKTEIERLKNLVADKGGLILMETAKAEAIKEFAERLKEKAYEVYGFYDVVEVSDIDYLVKEMVGE